MLLMHQHTHTITTTHTHDPIGGHYHRFTGGSSENKGGEAITGKSEDFAGATEASVVIRNWKSDGNSSGAYAPRIIFAVPMPWPLKDDLAKDNLVATISTWGSHAAKLVLIVSEQQIQRYPPDSELSGDGHSQIKDYLHAVPMKRADGIKGGRNIWEKMWRGWKLVADRFRYEAEWFVKADLDTFIAVENMRAFLSFLDHNKPYYFGHTLFHDYKRHNLVFNSGTCYVLSRESLRRLAIRLERIDATRQFTYQCGDGSGAREDPHTAGCLRDMGVPASDSLDSHGKQRFLTFRPKDHLFAMGVNPNDKPTWFWLGKDMTKQLLDCCSLYPISFHNFKSYPRVVYEPEAYYRLEYFLSSKPYEVIVKSIDPPRGNGQPFEVRDNLGFKVDKNRNGLKVEKKKKYGEWLKSTPAAYNCVNRTKSCRCHLPEPIPHLGPGVTIKRTSKCFPGARIEIGDKCEVSCEEDFVQVDPSNSRFISCPDGALLYPEPLRCKAKCDPSSLKALQEKVSRMGDTVREGLAGAEVTCGQGRSLPDGKKSGTLFCKKGQLSSQQACSDCVKWTLTLKGTSYTHRSWKKVEFDGNADTEFEIAAVATGSRLDPVRNCHKWNQGQQLLLRLKGGDGDILKALSCGNQVISIERKTKKPRKCN